MPEKSVILCEGDHDILFLSQLIENKKIPYEVISREQLQHSHLRSPETYYIKQFLRPKNCKNKFLLKNEDGYSRCIKSFTFLYENKDQRFLLMLCLDSSPQNLENLRSTIKKHLHRDILLKFGNCVRSTTNLSLGKEEWIVWIFGR